MRRKRSNAFHSTGSGLTVLGSGAEVSRKNDFSSDVHVPTNGKVGSPATPPPLFLSPHFFLPPTSAMDGLTARVFFLPFPFALAPPIGVAPMACPSPNLPILFHLLACSSTSSMVSLGLRSPVHADPSLPMDSGTPCMKGGGPGGGAGGMSDRGGLGTSGGGGGGAPTDT